MPMTTKTTRLQDDTAQRMPRAVASITSALINRLAPGLAVKRAQENLLSPSSRRIDLARLPHDIQAMRLDTREGNIQTYHLGDGPAVLLIHGWAGGAYQFFPLMRGLSRCGFKAVAFDHFGHGHSSGDKASLQSFVSATNLVLKFLHDNARDGMAGLVAHSMGCIALANANAKLLGDTPMMLIAPVFNFREFFARQVRKSGLSAKLAAQCLARLENGSGPALERMALDKKLVAHSDRTVIVHDKTDDESNFIDSVNFCSANPLTRLNATTGQGHERIMHSESVWQQLKSHLNYEDITTSPFYSDHL
jgi:pimeloyl-ACP methyl ester carboxylesterase